MTRPLYTHEQVRLRSHAVSPEAYFVASIIVPVKTFYGKHPVVDVWSDGFDVWLSPYMLDPSGLRPSHTIGCASMQSVQGTLARFKAPYKSPEFYSRVHTAGGVTRTGAGFGAALYMAAALVRLRFGEHGIYSPRSSCINSTPHERTEDAHDLWSHLWSLTGASGRYVERLQLERARTSLVQRMQPDATTQTIDADVLLGRRVLRSGLIYRMPSMWGDVLAPKHFLYDHRLSIIEQLNYTSDERRR